MGDPEAPKSWQNWLNIEDRYHRAKQSLWTTQQYNLRTLRQQPLAEISGSVGDMGTLLPILIALTKQNAISLSSTLVFGGLANIFTGIVFGIPLPVQPMKAIAAVAIARDFTQEETMSAGLFVAAAIGLLSITGLIRWFTHVIPLPVVKGIQIGTGLSLMTSAGSLYAPAPHNPWILLLAFLGLLASSSSSTTFKRVPYALIILLIGILTFTVDNITTTTTTHDDPTPLFSLWHPTIHIPSPRAFLTGSLDAGIGQLPLTTLNSIIAVSFLAADLFPPNPPNTPSISNSITPIPTPPSTTALALSVSTINLLSLWFSAMPICHGSGGLAAQHRFGARSGASVIILGVVKLMLGVFASPLARGVCEAVGREMLCVLLVAAGLELVWVGGAGLDDPGAGGGARGGVEEEEEDEEGRQRERRKRRWAVCFTTVAGIIAFRNDAVGFAAGMLCHWSFGVGDWWEERRAGSVRLGEEDDGVRGQRNGGGVG